MEISSRPDEPTIGGDAKKVAARSIARSAAPGVKIVFSDGDGPKQTLYYFSTNLADGSMSEAASWHSSSKLAPADSFIKSASYLLHSGGFSKVRGILLDHSATILEDDSGIPLAYFDPKKWRLQPFGRYVGPLGSSAVPISPEWRSCSGSAAPIEFGIGYRWQKERIKPAVGAEGSAADQRPGINACFTTPSRRSAGAEEDQKEPRNRAVPAHWAVVMGAFSRFVLTIPPGRADSLVKMGT